MGLDFDPQRRDAELEALRRRVAELEARLDEQERPEEALEGANGQRGLLATVVEQATEIIFVTDPEGIILYVNPAFERVTGYSREEAVGRTPRLLRSGEHDAAFYDEMWSTIRRGEVWTGHLVNRRKDGTVYHEEATITPVKDAGGEIVNFVAVKRDATRETELEAELRQARKMDSFGRVAGGVAHDFNNLLSPIIGYTDMLLRTVAADDRRHRQLRAILDAAESARDLTQQLLAFSRKQVLEMVPVDLADVVEGFRQILRRTIREDVEMTFLLSPGAGTVRADPAQLEQVLMNLAVNAQDAMPEGGRMVIETAPAALDPQDTATRPWVEPGPYVVLRVSDTGSGMDEATLEQAFEPFFTTKDRGKGTGLGLSTVHGIVKQHGGDIRVESWPGQGTTFHLYLPRIEEMARTSPRKMRRAETARGKETILVVEDDEPVRRLVCEILRDTGYEVIEAGNALEGIRQSRLHEGDIDLLLTDVVMPGMSGPELYEQLRRTLQELKVLYMSGYADDVVGRHRSVGDGAGFLAKPITLEALSAKVRQVLDG